MMKSAFVGSGVALITPFVCGKIDYKSLGKMIDFQLEHKTDAIILLGTTGEPATICDEDKKEMIKFAKERINGKAKLIVGSGANSTKKAIENSILAQSLGADGLLVVTPYYNKCTQKGLLEHYKAISYAVNIPIICYNVPLRTGVNITPETALALSQIENIAGIKEASGNINQITTLCRLLDGKMAVYSGDDGLNYVFMTLGASGVISVTANVLPSKVKSVVTLCQMGQYEEAKSRQNELEDINKALFLEVNPIPVKYACHLIGLCRKEIRLPLTFPEKATKQKLKTCLEKFCELK